jgi:hypothetical protein
VIGEIHDHPAHHENQGAVIAALAPTAVVFEMLSPEAASAWDPALLADPASLDAALGWTGAGWPGIDLYLPVFQAIPEGAAVLGAAPPGEAVRAAIEVGAAEAFEAVGDPARFGLAEPLPPEEQAAREAMQGAVHCDALPPGLLPGFVEAQRLRDAAFARAVLDALEAHGPPVVLVTGNGHARTDWGVPAALARAAPATRVHAIVQTASPEAAPPADAAVTTPPRPAPAEDPCAAFAAPESR